jgi:hypothetical protein
LQRPEAPKENAFRGSKTKDNKQIEEEEEEEEEDKT